MLKTTSSSFGHLLLLLCFYSLVGGARRRHENRRADSSLDEISTSDILDAQDKISSVSITAEEEIIYQFHDAVTDIMRLYDTSLLGSLRRKRKILMKFLLTTRGIGETHQMDLIKEWAVASLTAVKDRAEFAHKKLKAAITERWQYGRREGWKRNRFISGQRPNNKDEERRDHVRQGRLHHLRDDRGDPGDFLFH